MTLGSAIQLSTNEVHFWRYYVDPDGDELPVSEDCLSEDERTRAGRFKFEMDRRRYVSCRSILRGVLGRYLYEDPGKIEFRYGPAGKPRLAGGGEIRFNMSHSHSACVIAVARGREVGVDVEQVRGFRQAGEIARRFLSRDEWRSFAVLPDDLRDLAFFRCWVRKEALLKATGLGFSHPSGDSADAPSEREADDRWRLQDLPEWTFSSGERYVAAVTAEGGDWIVQERNPGDLILE